MTHITGFCVRCGACCRPPVLVHGRPCEHFVEPNVCRIYEQRPSGCRNWPHPQVTKEMLDPTCGFRVVAD